MQDVVCSARSVFGSFNYTHQEFGEVLELIGSGRMASDRLISKVVSLGEATPAFDDLFSKPDELMKIIMDLTR